MLMGGRNNLVRFTSKLFRMVTSTVSVWLHTWAQLNFSSLRVNVIFHKSGDPFAMGHQKPDERVFFTSIHTLKVNLRCGSNFVFKIHLEAAIWCLFIKSKSLGSDDVSSVSRHHDGSILDLRGFFSWIVERKEKISCWPLQEINELALKSFLYQQ